MALNQSRERDALQELYREHASELRDVLARLAGPRLDPDDLLHEVFMVALQKRTTFEGSAPPRPWLFGVAAKVVANARRRARLREFLRLEDAVERADPRTPASIFEAREASRRVYGILDRMSEKRRTVFILFEIEGMTGEEIAQVLRCPVKTVWTRLFHARRAFLAHLGQAAKDREG